MNDGNWALLFSQGLHTWRSSDCMFGWLFYSVPQFVIIYCYCCRQAQQPVLFCKHSSAPEKSVQHLCNIIVITQTKCTFLLNGGMTKTNQPAPRLCCCFGYTHISALPPLSRGQDLFRNQLGGWKMCSGFILCVFWTFALLDKKKGVHKNKG